MLHSTNHFLDEINKFKFKVDHKLVSFDVQSLFTNVPLDETINIIADYIYSKDNQIKDNLPSMKKEVFIKLLHLANQEMFLYKDKLYQQHDGVGMGSSLALTLANFFLAHIENKLLGKQSDFNPKLYSRYVDDIFAVFDNSDHCTKFLDLLNSQHNNIKFTVKFPSATIPFLDVEIRLNKTGIDTWVYRKPTNTNLILNFNVLCPTKWKSGLIVCFLNQAKHICFSDFFF